MSKENWALLIMSGYFVLFMGIAGGAHLWKVKRRGGRAPVAFKLLRGPGETIRRRMAKFDEELVERTAGAALGPIVVTLPVVALIDALRPQTWTSLGIGLVIAAAIFIVTLVFSLRWVMGGLKRYRDDRLGYLGEREVAEHLMPLVARGYRIFHDVPAGGKKSDFNLDHVAVGPSGVAVIETKTRRKGRARPGMKDHVVTYDGKQLTWPWGQDRHGLDQAVNEAEWLRQFIHQRTGIATAVKPILALPGWWVESRGRGDVAVINSKNLAGEVDRDVAPVLLAKQIDLIARQLDVLCRDVED
jgi:hypothetical protein